MKCRTKKGAVCGNTHTTFKDGYCHLHRDQKPPEPVKYRQPSLPISNTDGLAWVRRIKAQLEGGE